jgi:sulfur-carrier protein
VEPSIRWLFVAVLRLFAGAREAAGTKRVVFDEATVADVLAAAVTQFGPGFAAVLTTCKIWVNGEPATGETTVGSTDEVAVLPPVSGGSVGP